MKLEDTGSEFDIYVNNELFGHFDIPLYGEHMVLDAAAAIALTKELGFTKDEIHASLETFVNAKRRFAEEKINGSIIIDDYAHHPTEIKVTLEAIKQKYPNKKLIVVFVPNTYSRTKDFTDEFVKAFNIADKAYLTDIDANREDPKDYPGITSYTIIDKLNNGDIISIEEINKLKDNKDDVVCFMGCAYVDGILNAYKDLLKK
ncbi:MAG: hypothetical protein IJ880_16745 [Bacilli bacterium]|nr:hypothetical protein [Bacilli bacterium]